MPESIEWVAVCTCLFIAGLGVCVCAFWIIHLAVTQEKRLLLRSGAWGEEGGRWRGKREEKQRREV